MLNRRSLITGLVSLVAAPAIVRASNLMPVKQMRESGRFLIGGESWSIIDDHYFSDGEHPGRPIKLELQEYWSSIRDKMGIIRPVRLTLPPINADGSFEVGTGDWVIMKPVTVQPTPKP